MPEIMYYCRETGKSFSLNELEEIIKTNGETLGLWEFTTIGTDMNDYPIYAARITPQFNPFAKDDNWRTTLYTFYAQH